MPKPFCRHIDQSNAPLPHKTRATTTALRPHSALESVMKLKIILLLTASVLMSTASGASASTSRHQLHPGLHVSRQYNSSGSTADGRPSAWCGWEMRHLVGGNPGPEYNLARNWAHWGRPASGPAPG